MEDYHLAFKVSFYKGAVAKAILSREGQFILVNEAYSKLLEYSEMELQRKTFSDITDPEDRFIDESESQRIADGKIESYEMIKSHITKTKKLIKVKLRVDGVRDEEGNFLCFVAQVTPFLVGSIVQGQASLIIDIKTAKIITYLHKNAKWILWMLSGLAALGYYLKTGDPNIQ